VQAALCTQSSCPQSLITFTEQTLQVIFNYQKRSLYGFETWSPKLIETPFFGAFENSVSRKIFVYKREEVVTSWRKFQNGKLQNLYASLENQTKEN
jgi:hypothetical protein